MVETVSAIRTKLNENIICTQLCAFEVLMKRSGTVQRSTLNPASVSAVLFIIPEIPLTEKYKFPQWITTEHQQTLLFWNSLSFV